MRISLTLVAGLLLTAATARAGEPSLAKNWKVTLFLPGQELAPWLVKIEAKDDKLSGKLTTADGFPASELKDLAYKDKKLTFMVSFLKQSFPFQFPVAKPGAKKLYGTFSLGGSVFPVQLTPTDETTLTWKNTRPSPLSFDKAKEIVTKTPDSGQIFEALGALVRGAGEEKVTVDELRGWVNTTLKSAVNYGPEWRQEIAFRTTERLAAKKEFAALGQELAQQLLRDLGEKAAVQEKLRALTALVKALKKAGKEAEAHPYEKTLNELSPVAHKDYEKTALGFEPEKYPGRKKGNRVVVVELFTGAQCPPCVAADMGFDALERAFTTKDVILLQYHLHIPGPDALTTPDTEARQEYYGDDVRGTPSIFFSGQNLMAKLPREEQGGGGKSRAEDRYQVYRKFIEPLLKTETSVKLTAAAVRQGDKIQINATVDGLKKPGEKVKLRLALIEEWVYYRGGNGLPFHHRVVRALPGGAKGLALTKESDKQSVSFDLATLRKDLSKFLGPADLEDPTGYRHLSLVAFVQDDDTREVLQAIEVPVRRE